MSTKHRRIGTSSSSLPIPTPSPLPRPKQLESSSSSSSSRNNNNNAGTAAPFRPGIAIIVGALTTIFSLTFLLLLYAKHCRRSNFGNRNGGGGLHRNSTQPRHSGVDRSVVESLPLFRFGSLRGQKDGVECAVCLGLFDPAELLRLLPKCKHAFHIECVDTWLDAHSSCPLCRCRVNPEDILLISDLDLKPQSPISEQQQQQTDAKKPQEGVAVVLVEEEDKKELEEEAENVVVPNACGLMFAARLSGRHSWAGEKSTRNNSQVAVNQKHRWRKSIDDKLLHTASSDSTFPSSTAPLPTAMRKDKLLLPQDSFERRFGHRIILSSDLGSEIPTDLRPSDLLFLRRDQMIIDDGRASYTSGFFGSDGRSISARSRCQSEIVGRGRRSNAEIGGGAGRSLTEERYLRRWVSWLGTRGVANNEANS